MKIFILQENYTDIIPDSYYDEEDGGYVSEEYEKREILGVFTTLDAAVSRMVEVVKKADNYYSRNQNCMSGYEIHEADTETSEVKCVPSSLYLDMFRSKELGREVRTIAPAAVQTASNLSVD